MQAAQFLTVASVSAVFLAVIAWVGENKRLRRKDLDRVGFMPWTGIFFVAVLAAVVLIALAVKQWVSV